MDVWKLIECLKQRKRWTDHDLAKAVDRTSKSWLYNIRRGIAGPGFDAACRLAQLLENEKLITTEAEKNAFIVNFQQVAPAAA